MIGMGAAFPWHQDALSGEDPPQIRHELIAPWFINKVGTRLSAGHLIVMDRKPFFDTFQTDDGTGAPSRDTIP